MRLCIDASNLRAGGGVTHLQELLRRATPGEFGFEQVVVWASAATLSRLEDRPWLVKKTDPALERNYLVRALWQRRTLGRLAADDRCDLLYVPGGSFATTFRPIVTMSRNMLPFEPAELRRFGLSAMGLKMLLLRWTQPISMRRADGTIFLTRYARDTVLRTIGAVAGQVSIIPHGIDERFALSIKPQQPRAGYSNAHPFRFVYVSTVDVYKHQIEVAEAVAMLRDEGRPVALDLIGPAYAPSLAALRKSLDQLDPDATFIRYLGPVPYASLQVSYASADAAVFASSCENMPNILLEKMAAGLPIACSDRGPMPEMLGEAGLYFDPDSSVSVAACLRRLLDSPELRSRLAKAAQQRAAPYSWDRCARETLSFLAVVARRRIAVGSKADSCA